MSAVPRTLAVPLALLLVLSGCASRDGQADGTATPATSGAGEALVIAVDGEPSNLNPVFGDVFGSFNGDHWPIFSSLLS